MLSSCGGEAPKTSTLVISDFGTRLLLGKAKEQEEVFERF
jgi:hypothetical protein